MKTQNKINFRFSKNWAVILSWYEKRRLSGIITSWEEQKRFIQTIFESQAPAVVNWPVLWDSLQEWYIYIKNKNGKVTWKEQQRQIEREMLTQLEGLNSEVFILVYLDKDSKPQVYKNQMTYWDALKMQNKLSGDGNGVGGRQDMDKVTIVNLSNLIS